MSIERQRERIGVGAKAGERETMEYIAKHSKEPRAREVALEVLEMLDALKLPRDK